MNEKDMDTNKSMYKFLYDYYKDKPVSTRLSFMGYSISNSFFFSEIKRIADCLITVGVKKGDCVALNLPNTPHAVITFYAINKIGAVASIIHPMMPVDNLIKIMKKSNATILFALDLFLNGNMDKLKNNGIIPILCSFKDYMNPFKTALFKVKTFKKTKDLDYTKCILYKELKADINVKSDNILINPEDTAVLLHSGGTTGEPKTIMIDNQSQNCLVNNLREVIDDPDNPGNSVLMVLPIFHCFGLGVCMHTCLNLGFKIVLMPMFDAKSASKLIKKEKITMFAGVPNMFEKFLHCKQFFGEHLSNLKYLFCGGDKLPYNLKMNFDRILHENGSNAELLEGYGLTEASICSVNRPCKCVEGSLGTPLNGIKFKITDDNDNILKPYEKGQICVSGNTIMKGYYEDDETTKKCLIIDNEGVKWIYTGDYGYIDNANRLYFVDRIKRLIKISGYNVFPAEIEHLVSKLNYVKNCCAVDYKTDSGKIYIELFVVIDDNKINKEEAKKEIINLCNENLIKYSIPKKITFKDSLPLTLLGKVDYKKVKDMNQ